MLTIGVYDSGIGGLTTLKELIKVLGGGKFVYFADNANMPFGTKSEETLKPIITAHLEKLRILSDLQVVACNTASTLIEPKDMILLKPQLEKYAPENTLILATPSTLKSVKAKEKGYETADVKELATLVEIVASLSFKRRRFDFTELYPYLVRKLHDISDKTDILIGCSHYVYLENIVKSIAKSARLDDGNQRVLNCVLENVKRTDEKPSVKYVFSGTDESAKYQWLLSELLKND